MLYTLNGQYPTQLPFRITLSDGRVRTDHTTFTPEEIADAGYTQVADPPSYNSEYQSLGWDGTNWTIDTFTLESYKAQKKEGLEAVRYNHEISHPAIDTSRQGQAMLNSIWSASKVNPDISINYKHTDGTWEQLGADAINAVATIVISWVQDCFNHEKYLCDIIDACSTHEEVLLVNLEAGWPSAISSPQV